MYFDDDYPRSNGCMGGALIIAIGMIVVAGIFYFTVNRAASSVNPFGSGGITNPLAPQPTAIIVDRPAVVREIRSLNRLETTTAIIDKVVEAGQEGNALYNLLVGDKILLVASGEVIAGVDLSKLQDQDIILSSDGTSATITLPPTEILISRLDNDETRVYDRQRGLLTKGNVDLESEARRVAEQEIVRAACDRDLLTRAAEDGKTRMTGLLRSLGFEQVTVNTSAGPCTLAGGAALPPLQPTVAP